MILLSLSKGMTTVRKYIIPQLEYLTGHWTFDVNGTDSSGKGHDLTLTSTSIVPGLMSNCVSRENDDGTDTILLPSAHDDFKFGTGDFTVALWVNMELLTAGSPIFDTRAVDGSGGFCITQYDIAGRLALKSLTGYPYLGLAGACNVTPNEWNFIVLKRTSGVVNCSVNAVANATNISFESTLNTGLLSFGKSIGSESWISGKRMLGKFDSCYIWKGVALSQSEIEALYNSGNGFPTG